MREEDKELLKKIKTVEDFIALCEQFDREGIHYDELHLAKQYELIHSPFTKIEPEN